ncbi:MAG: hypothetical protein SPJ50_09420 [Ligilactobacillus salivarius]|nr:hypothetical protein [Ligilactobacillus salivarius]
MTDTKMDALQNSVYVLKNTLSKYANKLAEDDDNSKTSVAEVIYNVLLQMSKQENDTEETKNLRAAFKGVPLSLHVQALKSFINSFYISNHLGSQVQPSDKKTETITNELMATTDNFFDQTGKVLSPFEAIYLTIDSYVQQDTLRNAKRREEASLFIGDIKAQRRILVDYLNRYERQYGATLREANKEYEKN